MPQVDITIGRRHFQLVCEEGQEAHLQGLANQVSERIDMLAEQMDTHNDNILLVMSALMMQDENNELKERHKTHAVPSISPHVANDIVVEALDAVSDYVDGIAARIAQKA